ncbi:MAG: hypothetical protein K0S44_533 [Bacteroidetes bacterium]|jgi:hypothetical protein|nr:hypothetical protein [Bacteroidota bacterium]
MEENEIQPEMQKKRPVALTIICILTFIFSGLSIIGSLFTTPMADMMIAFVQQQPQYNEADYADSFILWKAGWAFYLINLLLLSVSLTGAILMWNLRRIGFHLYTISNIIIFYLPILWLGLPFNAFLAFLSLMFIGMYAMHLRYMK